MDTIGVTKKTEAGKKAGMIQWDSFIKERISKYPDATPKSKDLVEKEQINLFLDEFGYYMSNKKYRDSYYSISTVMSALSAVKTYYETTLNWKHWKDEDAAEFYKKLRFRV